MRRAEEIGLDFEGAVERLRGVDWAPRLAAATAPDVVLPAYYTRSFHAYPQVRPPSVPGAESSRCWKGLAGSPSRCLPSGHRQAAYCCQAALQALECTVRQLLRAGKITKMDALTSNTHTPERDVDIHESFTSLHNHKLIKGRRHT